MTDQYHSCSSYQWYLFEKKTFTGSEISSENASHKRKQNFKLNLVCLYVESYRLLHPPPLILN